MSYDVWITTRDVDGNRLDVPVVDSQFGLGIFYAKAMAGEGIKSIDGKSCKDALPVLEAALLNLVKYRASILLQVTSTEDPEELYEACFRTLFDLVALTHKHPSGFVRVAE